MFFRSAVRMGARRSFTPLRTFQPTASAPVFTSFNRSFCEGSLLSPDEIQKRVVSVVKNFEKVDAGKVNEKSHFANDLGLDSLDAVELILAVEEEFSIEIPDEASNGLASVPDVISYLATHPNLK